MLFQCSPFHAFHLWHWVEPGINRTLSKTRDEFTAKDVYWYLRDSRATLFLILDEGEFRGFIVVEVTTHVVTGARALGVWLMYFIGAGKVREELDARIKWIAKRANCSAVEFKSPRLGWKEAERHGYKMKMITWRCEL